MHNWATIKLLFCCFGMLLLVLFSACQSPYGNASRRRINDEKIATELLRQARHDLAEGNFEAAERAVKCMRDTCPYALEGREMGILLLDSIALRRAEADTSATDRATRIEFYKHKLEHDLKQRISHK